MRSFFTLIAALLFALCGVLSPSIAAASGGMIAWQEASPNAAYGCDATEELLKVISVKPCGKKVNGKVVLPCHLPPVVLPKSACLFVPDAKIVKQPVMSTPWLPTAPSGQFRPPRHTVV